MMLSRPRLLSSDRATNHGSHAVSVASNISSRTRLYSSQRANDLKSILESFQILRPSSIRALRRLSCSSGLTSSQ
jgi:hypothetical protein